MSDQTRDPVIDAMVKAAERDAYGPPLCPRCPHPFHEYVPCPDCTCHLTPPLEDAE